MDLFCISAYMLFFIMTLYCCCRLWWMPQV